MPGGKSGQKGTSMFQAQADAIYLTDNGAAYCGSHLGASARFTGRDISGQPIHKITIDDVREADAMGFTIACETCGKHPSAVIRIGQ